MLKIGDTEIEDTFAEAFPMKFCRILVTAHDRYWLEAALREATGYSSSVIACDVEAGVERYLGPQETPDGRPGAIVMMFGFSSGSLAKAVPNRIGQCVMTCPTTAAYDGMPAAENFIPLGKHIRFFGDGYQKSKQIAGRRYWRIPVMDGEFLIEDQLGIAAGIGGGNIIIQASDVPDCLAAVRRATDVMASLPGIMTPFPGGVARSGSKVGSRYKSMRASTADAYCPTLRGKVSSQLRDETQCALEIVIDGESEQRVGEAMRLGMQAAAGPGILLIGAGNYGGKLGKYHFALHGLLQ